jgi:hypothetical protein
MIGKAWAVESVWGALHVSDIQPTVRLRGLFSFAQGTPHLVWQLPCRNSNDYVRMLRRVLSVSDGAALIGLEAWIIGVEPSFTAVGHLKQTYVLYFILTFKTRFL